MQQQLVQLISHLQAMKLAYHNAHHVCGRVAFFADHSAFGDFYSALDSDYDDVNERFIGLFNSETLPFASIVQSIAQKLTSFPSGQAKDNTALFIVMLSMEQELISLTEMICKLPECREADKQLISEIGNKAASRTYKIKQRIKK